MASAILGLSLIISALIVSTAALFASRPDCHYSYTLLAERKKVTIQDLPRGVVVNLPGDFIEAIDAGDSRVLNDKGLFGCKK